MWDGDLNNLCISRLNATKYILIYLDLITINYKLNITSTMEAVDKNTKTRNCKDAHITSQNIDQIMLLPIKHVNAAVGPCNKIFLGFIQLLNNWISVPEDKLAIIREIILDLNTYSAIDDILDYTTLRSGIPTAHKIFGIGNTVNGFDFLMCGTLEKVMKLNHPEAMAIYLEAFRLTVAGQGIEINWRDSYVCPTEEEYEQMAIIKGASWLSLLARLMQLFDSTHKDTERFTSTIGLYGQIINDYHGLTNPKYFASKGFCDDISEGKCNFLMVHAINSHPEEKKTIIGILRERTKDIERKKQFLSILEKCGSFEYTLNKLESLKLIMFEEVKKLGENPLFSDCLEYFAESN